MPVSSILIDDIQKNIITKIRSQLISDISKTISIPETELVIRHTDSDLTLTDAGGNTSPSSVGSNIDSNRPTTKSSRRIVVNMSNEMDEDDIATAAIHQRNSFPIFQDKEIGVEISPMYIRDTFKIEFSFQTASRSEAIRLYDQIRIGVTQTRNVMLHTVEYTIPVPLSVQDLITDVYDLKNRLFPQTLEDYFTSHSTNRFILMTDMANDSNKTLAIHERQSRILGQFEFNPIPDKIEKDTDKNTYTLTFNYTATIDTPRAFVLRYPVMVCNKLMPNKYLEHIEKDRQRRINENLYNDKYTSIHNYNLSMFEFGRELDDISSKDFPLNIPLFDEFQMDNGHVGYVGIVSVLTDVNETDKRTLFNLRDMAPYYIDDQVLEFIRTEERFNCIKPYESFMYISLYQEGRYYDAPMLTIDNDLNVRSKIDLSLVTPVRVVISYLCDLTYLNKQSYQRLKLNQAMLMRLMNEYVRIYTDFRREVYKSNIKTDKLYESMADVISYYSSIYRNDVVENLLDSFKDNTEIYNMTLNTVNKTNPDVITYLVNKDIIPNVDYDKIDKDYILPQEPEIKIDTGTIKPPDPWETSTSSRDYLIIIPLSREELNDKSI